MAISERSQRILDLWTAYNAAEVAQKKATLSKNLKKMLLELIDVQLPIEVKRTNFSSAKLKTELLESVDGDILRLCEELSEQRSARDVVNGYLAAAAAVLQDCHVYERDTENPRLMELLRAYRASKLAERETHELYKALEAKMQIMAGHLLRRYSLLPEDADEAISLVMAKWLRHGDLLHGWREDGGAAISTWVYKALNYVILDLRRRVTARNKRLAYGGDLFGGNDEGKPETDVIGKARSRRKTQTALIGLDQLEAQMLALFQEIPGKQVILDKRNVTLTDKHAEMFQYCCNEPDLTDAERAERLGVPYGTAKRWLRELSQYVRNHPSRDELLDLLWSYGSWDSTQTIIKVNIHESPLDWAWNKEEARVEGDA
ncbi:MAG: RNA polymerase sigma factor [Methylobacter sp.]